VRGSVLGILSFHSLSGGRGTPARRGSCSRGEACPRGLACVGRYRRPRTRRVPVLRARDQAPAGGGASPLRRRSPIAGVPEAHERAPFPRSHSTLTRPHSYRACVAPSGAREHLKPDYGRERLNGSGEGEGDARPVISSCVNEIGRLTQA
jgi:hypothetical protein